MSPFPQSVADPSTFPVVLHDPPLPGVIQVAIVLLRIQENLKGPRWICG